MAETADGSSPSPATVSLEVQSPVGSSPNRNGFSLSSEIEAVDKESMDSKLAGGFLSSAHIETLGDQSVEPRCSDPVRSLFPANIEVPDADSLLDSLAHPCGSSMEDDDDDDNKSSASTLFDNLHSDSVACSASSGRGSILSSLNESDEQCLDSVAMGTSPGEILNCEDSTDDSGENFYSSMRVETKEGPSSPPGLMHCDEKESDDGEKVLCREYDRRMYGYGSCYNHQREGYLFNPPFWYRCQPWSRWRTDWYQWNFQREERESEEDNSSGFSFHMQETGPTGVGAGLSNLGNSCFINAILQCFTHTVSMVKALRSSNHPGPCGAEGFCILCSLREHIELSLASSGKVVSPVKLFDNLDHISSSFQRYHQEDAHEFLQCLLDRLERCCLDLCATGEMSSEGNNIVERVFGGRLVSKLRCCNCGHCSKKYEALIDLSLEIENVDTLQCALESFTKVEKIEDPESKVMCENCNEEASREKQLMLDRVPSVAIMHLKRFKSDGLSIEKIGKHVEFPLELDLKPYTIYSEETNIDLKYQLYAIVVHNGLLPTSGHYFCYIRSSPDTWHKLDDSMVINFKEDFVLSHAAYILFYAQEDVPWSSSLIDSPKLSSTSSTSPKSVLENMDGECASEFGATNIENGKRVVTEDATPGTSTALTFGEMLERKEQNETGVDVVGASEQIYHETSESEQSLCCDKFRDDGPVVTVSEPHGLGECHDAISCDGKSSALPSLEVNCNQASGRIMANDLHPTMPPQSVHPSAGGSPGGRNQFARHHLRVENRISCKRHSTRTGKHLERLVAERCLKRMPGSRSRSLMNAMLSRKDKKQRLRSSPCKRTSPPGSCYKSFRNVAVLR